MSTRYIWEKWNRTQTYKYEERTSQVDNQEIYIAASPDDEFPDITFEEIQQAVEQELGSMADNNAEELIAQSFGNFYYGKDKSRIAEAIIHFFKEALK